MWSRDVAERLRIRRKALARDAGLDESYDVGPAWPEPEQPGRVYVYQQRSGLGGYLVGTLATLLTGGAVAAGMWLALAGRPRAEPEVRIETQVETEGYRIEPRVVEPEEA